MATSHPTRPVDRFDFSVLCDLNVALVLEPLLPGVLYIFSGETHSEYVTENDH